MASFERAAKPGQELLPAAKQWRDIRTAKGYSGYSDGSVVVEVRDIDLNVMVLMRRFPSGEMIPIED